MSEGHPDPTDPAEPTAEVIRWPERPVRTERVGVLASGSGTTFEAIGRAWRDGEIDAGSLTLFATTPEAGAIKRAEALGIPSVVVDLRGVKIPIVRGDCLQDAMEAEGIQFAHCAGMTLIIGGRILETPMTNTHPMILPDDPKARAYGGYNMIGMRVHEKVVEDYYAGLVTRAGSTIHVVDAEPDHGPIVRVSSYDIAERARQNDIDPLLVGAEDIAAWTQADEKPNNVAALQAICREGRLRRQDDVTTA